jgi:hypothetical protein
VTNLQPARSPFLTVTSAFCLLFGISSALSALVGFAGVANGHWNLAEVHSGWIAVLTCLTASLGILCRVIMIPGEVVAARSDRWRRSWSAEIGLILSIVALPALYLGMVAQQSSIATRMLDGNNLKQLAIAMHNYHKEHQRFPPVAIRGKNGEPLLSWRVLLLPYLDEPEEELYREFHLDEPWDSPHNIKLLDRMPKVFRSPFHPRRRQVTGTYYQLFVGPGAVFEENWSASLDDIPDGPGKTILIGENLTEVPWTKPEDMRFAPEVPLPLTGHKFVGLTQMANADGSVRDIRKEHREGKPTELDPLRGYITRAAKDQQLFAEAED